MTDDPLDEDVEDPEPADDFDGEDGEPDLLVPEVYDDPVPEE